MRKIILATAAALLGAASLSACSSMMGDHSAAPATGTNSSGHVPDSPSQSAPSPQDVPH